MEQLAELLKQIQEMAGVGIDALKQAGGGKKPAEGSPEEEAGETPHEEAAEKAAGQDGPHGGAPAPHPGAGAPDGGQGHFPPRR